MEEVYEDNITPNNPTSLKTLADFLGQKKISVVVPKIQRAYAQGRKSEENIRIQFCDELFSSLENETKIELSFVYGSKVVESNSETIRFELLDGQQRITTLVLLYWFLACASGRQIPEWLTAFTYETRTTSTNFLHELSRSSLDVVNNKPSEVIRGRQWYTLAYDKDSSVWGMLNMLDTFHERYKVSDKKEQLFDNLDNIRFYELDLDDFGLTEEIYIKMNARGLQLTPFENFKADIIKYLKDEENPNFKERVHMEIVGHPEVDYYLNFSQKMDNRWLDIFWRKEDGTGTGDNDGRKYCARFFRFFYRYFANKYYMEVQGAQPADYFRPKTLPESEEGKVWHFLWTLSPKQERTYFGFKYYEYILNQYPQYIYNIEKILDYLADKEVLNIINAELVNPWEKNERREFFEEKYQLADAIYFAAVTEYLEQTGDLFDTTNFRKWMRVVRNVVENQLLRNVNEIVTIVRNFRDILQIQGATEDIYKAMASGIRPSSNNRSLLEEIKKAEIICSDENKDWEKVFIEAERHPLFRGAIGLLLENLPSSTEAFADRTALVGQLFDSNGIVNKMRAEHKLIRSFVRQLNKKSWLIGTTITEKNDVTNHLKSMMLTYPTVSRFVCQLGDLKDMSAVVNYIDSELMKPFVTESESGLLVDGGDERLDRAFIRLCLEPRIYDFIDHVENENRNKYMVISERDSNYAIDRARSWYDKIFLGTERKEVVDFMLGHDYSLWSEHQKPFKDQYGDYFGYRVWIEKNIDDGQKLSIEFHQGGNARFLVHKDQKNALQLFPNALAHDYEGWLKIDEIPASHIYDGESVLKKANEIETIIKNFTAEVVSDEYSQL
ncbi:MAG: DUF262 domain-containing protein [Bacteroides sp.]|nr:DUF262 domain-containing protein [Bacteroides sp.]